jgi:hypothetical protein
VTFTLARTTVRSATPPDTLAGTVRAEDPDGLDSVWVKVDAEEAGADGGFERVFAAPYRFVIAAGKSPGTHVPVQFRARDISGFVVVQDTFVVVVP